MTTTHRVTAWFIVAIVAVGACGGDDDSSAQDDVAGGDTSTSELATTTSTTPPSPEDDFETAMRRQLTVSDDAAYTDILDLALDACESITTLDEDLADDDAANDTPGSDAAISETMEAMFLATLWDNLPSSDIAEVVFRGMGDHLCPEIGPQIESFIEARTGG